MFLVLLPPVTLTDACQLRERRYRHLAAPGDTAPVPVSAPQVLS